MEFLNLAADFLPQPKRAPFLNSLVCRVARLARAGARQRRLTGVRQRAYRRQVEWANEAFSTRKAISDSTFQSSPLHVHIGYCHIAQFHIAHFHIAHNALTSHIVL
eukprot:10373922-Karenia_brevis.AAC.1